MKYLFAIAFGCLASTWMLPSSNAQESPKTVVFIAGGQSHDYGSHEHYAGSRILADVVEQSDSNVKCKVIRNGWPQDDSLLDSADAIVIYSDGGGGHPALAHMDRLQKQMDRGAGLVCIHYAVEVPKDRGGPEFLRWLGGYFETDWSVNPHWVANFQKLPEHPITTGVKPFSTNDEWYFHMRFREDMKGVTPILSAVPPASTMSRENGPHSGNDFVRAEVAKGLSQHVAWTTDREDGGRSFGYTGGHYHWNWGRTEPTKLVANAILWTAKANIPAEGANVAPKSVDQLKENQDEPVPDGFNPKNISDSFKLLSASDSEKKKESRTLFSTDTLNGRTPDQRVDIDVDIRDVQKLYLIVTPGRDGISCDWANWIEPKLVGPNGEKSLLDLDWFQATSSWGAPQKNANASGTPLRVKGKNFSGIGTHAFSVIGFNLPSGFERLVAGCALDDGGIQQQNGNATSVRFHVAAEGVPEGLNDWGQGNHSVDADAHNPEKAVSNLRIPKDLEATLSASEPRIKSLTNIDIDHRGRIWVCEVVNYRGHVNDRPEGDRILILEDTDQDGIIDTSKVYYQGKDIDSPLGLCVLGNRVLVSAAPYVFEFIDNDGDDIPDEKRAILTKTGQPQHDHSVHSFVFGADGKLYFNFGNTGHQLCDADGNPILDRWKRPINDSAMPYRQGMVFRCNEDFSDMEVVGNNFRNNYEAAIDSFGTIWQSDNDDDGNRATRINYVMEFGNYGFVDEMTGAGWAAERPNMEQDIPSRHWHLNDPGVVPNVYLAGAGSPTGITVYEGELLPKRYHNQVIHTDAGPNGVRGYITSADGAGYKATVDEVAVAERDPWFRPADVCVAPDGSLFISDWYDPGVGGHGMGDIERGRLFRIAPPGTKYIVPSVDFSTVEGAAQAFKSPNQATRYVANKSLRSFGEQAIPQIKHLTQDSNPRVRARALWLLSKMVPAKVAIAIARNDHDANVRIVGVRIARQHKLSTKDYLPSYLADSSPAVLRELCLALREDKSPEMPAYWSKLANRFDGSDRWYLEALGIAAMDRWDDCLQAWLHGNPDLKQRAAQRIVWRSRAKESAKLQTELLLGNSLADENVPEMIRSWDFQTPAIREEAFQQLFSKSKELAQTPRINRIIVEALMHSGAANLVNRADLTSRVQEYLKTIPNDPRQLQIIAKLGLQGMEDHLLERAIAWGPTSAGLQSLELSVATPDRRKALQARLSTDPPSDADFQLARVLALSNRKDLLELERELVESPEVNRGIRSEAAMALARNKGMQPIVIELAKEGKVPKEAYGLIGNTLRASQDPQIVEEAATLFPPLNATHTQLPPIAEMVAKQGDAAVGKSLYFGAATCSQCHVVNEQGQNVGPNFTEIGSKLSKDAMYVAILAPSAAISHNYEAYAIRTEDDEVVTGLLVSETAEKVVLKDAKGIERSFDRPQIAEMKKQDKSLMPENLQDLISEQGLIDLVEYLMTLQKK